MKLHDLAVPPVQLCVRGETDAATEKLALKAALTTAHLLGLAAGSFLRQLRSMNGPLAEAAARIRGEQVKAGLAWDIVEILSARLAKIPDRNRPHYAPSQRFRILEIKGFLGWSQKSWHGSSASAHRRQLGAPHRSRLQDRRLDREAHPSDPALRRRRPRHDPDCAQARLRRRG